MSVVQAQAPTGEREERLARARAALGAAERSASRWGGRIDRTALRAGTGRGGPVGLVPPPAAPAPTPPDPDAPTIAPAAPAEPPVAPDEAHTRLPVPDALAPLIPYGSLRAGSSLAVTGAASTSLLLALAATAAGEDAWCAIAGLPDLGLRAALDAGLDPRRLAIMPAAAEQTASVLSALVDGVGVVVLGPHLPLTPALWRALTGRARTRDTLVLAARPPGRADVQLEATALGWDGLGSGSGRLRRRRLLVASAGRGIAGDRETTVLLPEVRGMIAALPAVGQQPAATTADSPSAPVALHAVRRAG
ncbi:hypothetical protein BRM3_12115 [Brachybacterium huguangmaarense]|uniref:Protein RecA n=1 Tax=Brachybacterium huguangmaarense TaxID=1652028 RepID=A0ABY6FZK3_9MICO|nr:hypothetical protein [Brachybacterium huguangmaarense]UYG16345.1 hypothetical protein BRM3_12115 [Brachybacterium huguangmaarense]